jgi:hypothetical protein
MPLRLLLRRIALNSHGIPAHIVTAKWEEQSSKGTPNEQDTEIESDPGMQIEKDLASDLDNYITLAVAD